jgi:hypothetical protein
MRESMNVDTDMDMDMNMDLLSTYFMVDFTTPTYRSRKKFVK